MGADATAATGNGSPNGLVTEEQLFDAFYKMEVFRMGEFYLKSGQMTPIYIDLRRIISHPKTLRLAAQSLCDIIVAKGLRCDYVVGVPYAALPLATLVADILDIPMLLKRKEVKAYGTKQLIEGVYKTGGRVLLIEDVVTTGESIRETAEAIRQEGMEVVDSVAVLDRQQGATEQLASANLVFHSSLTMCKILDGMIAKGEINAERKKEIIEHLAKPF